MPCVLQTPLLLCLLSPFYSHKPVILHILVYFPLDFLVEEVKCPKMQLKKKTSLILQTLVSKGLCSELLSAHSWRPEQWWGTIIPFKWGADVWIQEGLWPRCNSGRALVYWNLCNPGPIVHLPRKNAQKTWSEEGLASVPLVCSSATLVPAPAEPALSDPFHSSWTC